MQRVGRIVAVSVVERAGEFDIGPNALGCLVAVGPVRWKTVVAVWIDQFQAAAAAIGPFAPAPSFAVAHLVHDDVDGIGDDDAVVGADDLVGFGKRQAITAVPERSSKIAERIIGRETGVIGQQVRGVVGDHHVAVRGKNGVGGESE